MPETLHFAPFTFRRDSGELARDGEPVPLPPQPTRALGLLLERPGELVSREELRRRVWGDDVHVDFEQGINFCLRQVRAALGDDADAPRFVATVPKRGYRFVAPVTVRTSPPAQAAIGDGTGSATDRDDPPPSAMTAGRDRSPGLGMWAAALVVALAAVAAIVAWRLADAARPARLVVLPLTSSDGSADPVLLDGLTEELIRGLAAVDPAQLAVIARTSALRYRDAPARLRTIGEELLVDWALEGDLRRQGDALTVALRLVRPHDEAIRWQAELASDRERPLALPASTAGLIAGQLLPATARGRVAPGSSLRSDDSLTDREATGARADADVPAGAREAYLTGRYLLAHARRGERDAEAIAAFERAVALAPAWPVAWAGLADALAAADAMPATTMARARQAALRALELDPSLAEAHHRLAGIHLYFDYDWDAAERAYARAVELAPGVALFHHSRAAVFAVRGRHDEALASIGRALDLDPVSLTVTSDTGWYFYWARRYDDAIAQSARALRLEPRLENAHSCLLYTYLAAGQTADAREQARILMELRDAPAADRERLAAAEDALLEPYWRFYLADLERRRAGGEAVAIARRALAVPVLPVADAIAALEQGYADRHGWVVPFAAVEPRLDPLRTDPAFRALLSRLRLAARGGGG